MAVQLKRVLDTLEGLPEGLQGLYTERDGKFILNAQVEGMVDKGKLDEFRLNNTELQKKLADLEGRALSDEEREEYEDLRKQQQLNKEKKLLDEGKVEELINARTEQMKRNYDAQVKKMQQALDDRDKNIGGLTSRLEEVLIDHKVSEAVTNVGVPRKGALSDILSRAKRMWKLVDGVPTPMEGEVIRYGADGKSPMSFEEWATDLMEAAPFLFEPSAGGGGAGRRTDDGTGGKRVIDRSDPLAFGKSLEAIAKGDAVAR